MSSKSHLNQRIEEQSTGCRYFFNLTENPGIMEDYDQTPYMAQVSVTISEETEKLLEEMAQVTGLTKSSLAAEILRQGLYREAANLNTVANFRENFRAEQPETPVKGKRRGKGEG